MTARTTGRIVISAFVLRIVISAFVLIVTAVAALTSDPIRSWLIDAAVREPTPAVAATETPPRRQPPDPPVERWPARCMWVIDGDTYVLELSLGWGVTTMPGGTGGVRIIGVDTPEDDEAGYMEASWAAHDLLGCGEPTWSLTVEPDGGTDRYGRPLVHVWRDDGANVGAALAETWPDTKER